MPEIVGVIFKNTGKTYYFDSAGYQVSLEDKVIVETSRGIECGEIVIANKHIGEDEFKKPLKSVIRIATKADLLQIKQNKEQEAFALKICTEQSEKHKLDMKLIDAEYAFDRSKIVIYFTADGRVDFRNLVKDLASVLKTRIELRQIGVRDEAKILGGIGICGREFCCSSFLNDFAPVSIRSAKEQGLSLNPTKISGACGRLMCCLKYEEEAYAELNRITPSQGSIVETPEGTGVVIGVSLLTGILQVKLQKDDGEVVEAFHRDNVVERRRKRTQNN